MPTLVHTKQEGTIEKLLGFITKKNGINFDNVWSKLACEQMPPLFREGDVCTQARRK